MRENIAPFMTDKFIQDVKKRQVLTFMKDGTLQSFRVVRLNRSKRICEVIPIKLHSLQEADEIMKQDLTLEDVLREFDGIQLSTAEDVIRVLEWIAPPGKKQDLKREAIAKLFKGTSPQGFKVVDSIESYEEF